LLRTIFDHLLESGGDLAAEFWRNDFLFHRDHDGGLVEFIQPMKIVRVGRRVAALSCNLGGESQGGCANADSLHERVSPRF
jgi:hypothetical protein